MGNKVYKPEDIKFRWEPIEDSKGDGIVGYFDNYAVSIEQDNTNVGGNYWWVEIWETKGANRIHLDNCISLRAAILHAQSWFEAIELRS